MVEDQAELALDLSNIIGGLPPHGYVVISNLPRGSRLSHGYDSGDNTWTLMVDDLPGLKFLPGRVRGIVSLRAQIFDPVAGGVVQIKREIPLVLHMADASQRHALESKDEARNTAAAPIRKEANKQGGTAPTCGEAWEIPNTSKLDLPSPERKTAELVSQQSSGRGITAPAAQGDRPATIGQEGAVRAVLTSAHGAEQSAVAEPPITRQKIWGAEAERLFATAIAQLRREADEVLKAAEQRHRSEVAELSRTMAKQQELIATLRKEAEQVANSHREAERGWQKAEAARIKAAQDGWGREKEELKREATLKEQESAAQLKKNIAEAESAIRAIFQTKIK